MPQLLGAVTLGTCLVSGDNFSICSPFPDPQTSPESASSEPDSFQSHIGNQLVASSESHSVPLIRSDSVVLCVSGERIRKLKSHLESKGDDIG